MIKTKIDSLNQNISKLENVVTSQISGRRRTQQQVRSVVVVAHRVLAAWPPHVARLSSLPLPDPCAQRGHVAGRQAQDHLVRVQAHSRGVLGGGAGCIFEARSVRRRLTHGLTHAHAPQSATLADPHREPQEAARAARAVFGCQLPPIHHQHILYVHIYCHSSFSSLTPPPKCPARSWTQTKAKALH